MRKGISVHSKRISSNSNKSAYIVKVMSDVLNEFKIPKYSSKFNNRVYDYHTKISLLVLRQTFIFHSETYVQFSYEV